jgi:phosphatidylserine/phosphatidylglycerophosphate/cardiolipin synthase-like enzyme
MAIATLALLSYVQLRSRPEIHVSAQATGAPTSENHYAPAQDLERLDVQEIDRARHTIDIAMYAFTDRYVADAVLRAAHRGVAIRSIAIASNTTKNSGTRPSTAASRRATCSAASN